MKSDKLGVVICLTGLVFLLTVPVVMDTWREVLSGTGLALLVVFRGLVRIGDVAIRNRSVNQ